MNAIRTLMAATILAALCSLRLPAQSLPPGSGQIARVEGKVYLDQQLVEPSSTPVWILNPNSVVRTEEGRAEIFLAGGVSLFLGENSAIKRAPSGPYNFSRFEPLCGSTVVTTGEMGAATKCENDVKLSDFGHYRFDVLRIPSQPTGEKHCGLKVYEGAVAVQLASVISVMTPGKFMSLNLGCGDMIPLQKFNVEDSDSLDTWSRERIRLSNRQ